MNNLILILFFILFSGIINGQLNITWELTTNANSYYSARAEKIAWDSEGNIIIAGYSWYGALNSNQTVFVTKITTTGELLWLKTYMGTGVGSYDNGTVNGLFIDSDDNIILFAKYFSQKVIKYNKDGDLLAENDYTFNLPFTINIYNNEYLFDKVHKDPSGNFLIGGIYSEYNGGNPILYPYLVIFNPQGNIHSLKVDTLFFIQYKIGSTAISAYENYSKIYFLGFCNYNNASGTQYSSINMEGNVDWIKGNWHTDYERYPLKMLRNNTGFTYYISYKSSTNGSEDGSYLTKLNVDGNIVWEKYFDGFTLTDFEFDKDGNIWLIGRGRYENKSFLTKYSPAGEKAFEIINEDNFACDKLIINSNNEAYFTVNNLNGVFVVKHNCNGDKLAEVKINNNWNVSNTILTFDSNNDLIVCSDYDQTIYIKKIIDNTTNIENEDNIPEDFQLHQNYPNPFNPSTTIKFAIPVSASNSLVTLKVYDVMGREVTTLVNEQKPAGEYEVIFNGDELSSGVYFYKLQSGSYSSVKKLVLLK